MKSIREEQRSLIGRTMNRNGHLSDISLNEFRQSFQTNIPFIDFFKMNVKSWNDGADSPNYDGSCLMHQSHIIWSEAEGRLMTAAYFNQVLKIHFCHVGAGGGVIKTALSADGDLSQSIYSRFTPLFHHHRGGVGEYEGVLPPSPLLPLLLSLSTLLLYIIFLFFLHSLSITYL